MAKKVAAVMGIGPGNGEALARRLSADGYAVALLARSEGKLRALADELPEARAFPCDASDPAAVRSAMGSIREQLGPVDTLVWNAGSGVFGTIEDVDEDALELAWRVNTLGLFAATKAVLPDMKEAGDGRIAVIGATASLRGGARFAAFAQAKAAQRNLVQSIARHAWPLGIHVCLVILDGMVDLERTRKAMPDTPEEAFLKPEHIADSVATVLAQPRSAWTLEWDLRPHVESF